MDPILSFIDGVLEIVTFPSKTDLILEEGCQDPALWITQSEHMARMDAVFAPTDQERRDRAHDVMDDAWHAAYNTARPQGRMGQIWR
jgi:hypothetical protein